MIAAERSEKPFLWLVEPDFAAVGSAGTLLFLKLYGNDGSSIGCRPTLVCCVLQYETATPQPTLECECHHIIYPTVVEGLPRS